MPEKQLTSQYVLQGVRPASGAVSPDKSEDIAETSAGEEPEEDADDDEDDDDDESDDEEAAVPTPRGARRPRTVWCSLSHLSSDDPSFRFLSSSRSAPHSTAAGKARGCEYAVDRASRVAPARHEKGAGGKLKKSGCRPSASVFALSAQPPWRTKLASRLRDSVLEAAIGEGQARTFAGLLTHAHRSGGRLS